MAELVYNLHAQPGPNKSRQDQNDLMPSIAYCGLIRRMPFLGIGRNGQHRIDDYFFAVAFIEGRERKWPQQAPAITMTYDRIHQGISRNALQAGTDAIQKFFAPAWPARLVPLKYRGEVVLHLVGN